MLKRLSLYGFKTFAKKTDIDFNDGITCIVGPNGSGKSNIADALRWILGEQGTKNLRSDKLTEVIFSGSEYSNPLNFAEVILLLENKSELFPLKFTEIEIIRRIHRDNRSEFFINRTPCRLRDIHEIFLDTGLGKGGISMIGQGQVDKIISADPSERRALFEETAGINKYQYRKHISLKKLEATQNNLLRLSDIIQEVESRIGPLKKEVNKLSRFKRYKERKELLEKQLLFQEYFSLFRKEQEATENVNISVKSVNELRKELEELEISYKEFVISLKDLRTISDREEDHINNLKFELEQVRTRCSSYEARKKELEDRIFRVSQLKKSLEEQKIKIRQELYQDDERLKETRVKIKELNHKINNTEIKYKNELEYLETLRKQSDLCNEDFLEVSRKILVDSGEMEHLLSLYEEIKSDIVKNQDIIKENNQKLNEHNSSKEELLKNIDNITLSINSIKSEITETREKKAGFIISLDKVRKDVNELTNNLSKKEISYNFLKDMDKDFEGYFPGVKAVMKAKEKNKDLSGLIGIVGSIIKVPEKYERAIEVALGGHIQDIVTETDKDARLAVEYLRQTKKGRATFLPLNIIKSPHSDYSREGRWINDYSILGQASKLIDYNPGYKEIINYLLSHYYIVKDLKSGIDLLKTYNMPVTLVTLEGDIIRPSGAITGGSMDVKKGNLLARSREIEKLFQEISLITKDKKSLDDKEKLIKSRIDETDRILSQKRINLSDYEQKYQELLRKKDFFFLQEKQINEALNQLSIKIDKDKDKLKNIDLSMGKYQRELESLREKEGKLKVAREDFEKRLSSQEIAGSKIMDYLTQLKIEYAKVSETEDNMNNFIISRKIQMEQIEVNYKSCLNDGEMLKDMLTDLVNKEKEDISKLSSIDKNYKKNLEKTMTLRDKRINRESDIEVMEGKISSMRDDLFKKEQMANELQLVHARLSAERELLLARLPEEPSEIDFIEPEKISQELEILQNRIDSMGFINYQSEQEYEEVDKRYRFLLEQKSDMEEAIFSLNRVIEDVDKKSREKFKETFNLVSSEFSYMFTKLFPGGRAYLSLTDEEDVLKSGIDVSVNPPGKKLQTISLLSGGEKTMAAIILLLSIFKIKPTPFCVFDEIDAALDDNNTSVLADCLKDFSHSSQFIVITHNKITMEKSDALYGVTMEEPGVSSIISLKLGDPIIGELIGQDTVNK